MCQEDEDPWGGGGRIILWVGRGLHSNQAVQEYEEDRVILHIRFTFNIGTQYSCTRSSLVR